VGAQAPAAAPAPAADAEADGAAGRKRRKTSRIVNLGTLNQDTPANALLRRCAGTGDCTEHRRSAQRGLVDAG